MGAQDDALRHFAFSCTQGQRMAPVTVSSYGCSLYRAGRPV